MMLFFVGFDDREKDRGVFVFLESLKEGFKK